jgi:hypothetical protein
MVIIIVPAFEGSIVKRIPVALALIVTFGSAAAQMPPPIDLGIYNLTQDTSVWCWAAVARQIIAWKRQDLLSTPIQCALVAAANDAPEGACCSYYNPACVVTGSIPQIQRLIAQFGASYSSVAPPADATVLYNTLASGRAIILQISTGGAMAHVVVLQGMDWEMTPIGRRAMLHVNDPMSVYPMRVPFEQISAIWLSAIVVN